MRNERNLKVLSGIMSIIGDVYGKNAKLGQVFNVTPRIQQTLETKIQNSNDFLTQINIQGVTEVAGDVLGFGVPARLLKRSTSNNGTTPSWGKRRPTDPTDLVERPYACNDYESDALISWDKLDTWVHLTNFYNEYLNTINTARAADRLAVGWNGQFKAANTNATNFPMLQDVQAGWIQYMIENFPDQVLGITIDGNANGGYTVDQINVGEGGDFESLDALVFHLIQSMIHVRYRSRTDLVSVVGDELLYENNKVLFGAAIAEPTEKIARELYLAGQTLGGKGLTRSDEFPQRGLFISPLKNISYYYQMDSLRRKLEEDHREKGVVDWMYGRDDYVIEAYEAACCVHPDAIHIKDANGDWTPASETWKAVFP